MLSLKKVGPTRLIKNEFFRRVEEAENRGASAEELKEILGFGRSRKGIFEGDLIEGELEIGQVSYMIKAIPTVQDVFDELLLEYGEQLSRLAEM